MDNLGTEETNEERAVGPHQRNSNENQNLLTLNPNVYVDKDAKKTNKR